MSAYSQSQNQPNQLPATNQNYQGNQGYGQSTGNIQPNQYGPSSNPGHNYNSPQGQNQQYPGYNYSNPYQGNNQGQNSQQAYQSHTTSANKMNVPQQDHQAQSYTNKLNDPKYGNPLSKPY